MVNDHIEFIIKWRHASINQIHAPLSFPPICPFYLPLSLLSFLLSTLKWV